MRSQGGVGWQLAAIDDAEYNRSQATTTLIGSIKEQQFVEVVIVSPKYQVVIPRSIREPLGLQPGQTMQVFVYDNRIELIPDRPIREMRGFLRGIDASVEREPDRV